MPCTLRDDELQRYAASLTTRGSAINSAIRSSKMHAGQNYRPAIQDQNTAERKEAVRSTPLHIRPRMQFLWSRQRHVGHVPSIMRVDPRCGHRTRLHDLAQAPWHVERMTAFVTGAGIPIIALLVIKHAVPCACCPHCMHFSIRVTHISFACAISRRFDHAAVDQVFRTVIRSARSEARIGRAVLLGCNHAQWSCYSAELPGQRPSPSCCRMRVRSRRNTARTIQPVDTGQGNCIDRTPFAVNSSAHSGEVGDGRFVAL